MISPWSTTIGTLHAKSLPIPHILTTAYWARFGKFSKFFSLGLPAGDDSGGFGSQREFSWFYGENVREPLFYHWVWWDTGRRSKPSFWGTTSSRNRRRIIMNGRNKNRFKPEDVSFWANEQKKKGLSVRDEGTARDSGCRTEMVRWKAWPRGPLSLWVTEEIQKMLPKIRPFLMDPKAGPTIANDFLNWLNFWSAPCRILCSIAQAESVVWFGLG